MFEFLTGPVPMWLFLLPFLLLVAGGIAIILAVKTPDYDDPPYQ